MAAGLGLNPETIEKDYVLGWLLWGINNHPELKDSWAFKGGTSLKKCFFQTFRFSEDLDFTIPNQDHLSNDFLQNIFKGITGRIYEETGIEFFEDQFKFKFIPKEKEKLYVQGKIHFNGPMRRRTRTSPASVKLDLTTDEVLVLSSVKKDVQHPYTDHPATGIRANCYAFEEVIAEKIRALAERLRPRDLYDVIHFFRSRNLIKNPQLVYNVLTKKCSYKEIEVPTYSFLEQHEKMEELSAQWKNMLAHQLPALPPIESFWDDLEPFFDWLEGKEDRQVEMLDVDGEIFQPGEIANASSMDSVIHKIQFAAANRVCVNLVYHNKSRTVEPLSFRTSSEGNRLFYGHEREDGHPKAFTLSKIQGVTITNEPYTENYPVEISSSGGVVMPPIRKKRTSAFRPSRARGLSQLSSGTKYTFKCSLCGKHFSRQRNNSTLKAHKSPGGYNCSGRHGYQVW